VEPLGVKPLQTAGGPTAATAGGQPLGVKPLGVRS
jgi:hypothetical protein